jgi:hypothetical protein
MGRYPSQWRSRPRPDLAERRRAVATVAPSRAPPQSNRPVDRARTAPPGQCSGAPARDRPHAAASRRRDVAYGGRSGGNRASSIRPWEAPCGARISPLVVPMVDAAGERQPLTFGLATSGLGNHGQIQ